MGEIMYSITGLEFSYSQAPVSMKSVMQACWLLTTAFGNLIVVIIESARFFEDRVSLYRVLKFYLKKFLSVVRFLFICRCDGGRYGYFRIVGNAL